MGKVAVLMPTSLVGISATLAGTVTDGLLLLSCADPPMGRWNKRVPVTCVPPIVELLDRVSFRSPAELGGGARSSADLAGVVALAGVVPTTAEMVEQPEPAALTLNVCDLAFGGTWIEAGTVATAVLLLKSSTVVDAGELPSSVTVPVLEPKTTGDRLTDETAITASTTGVSAGAARASHGPTLRPRGLRPSSRERMIGNIASSFL